MSESERPQTKLTARQLAAVSAMVTAPSIQAAAESAAVPLATLRRWRALPAFQEALAKSFDDLWAQMTGRLQGRCDTAIDTLETVCKVGDKDAARVSAAKTILQFAFQARADLDLLARVARLEELVEEREDDR